MAGPVFKTFPKPLPLHFLAIVVGYSREPSNPLVKSGKLRAASPNAGAARVNMRELSLGSLLFSPKTEDGKRPQQAAG